MTLPEELRERAASYRISGPSAEHTAELLERAAHEIEGQAVPSGYVLVPEIATDEMLAAIHRFHDWPAQAWSAALEAAGIKKQD